jgi:hypothetical protein
MEMIPITAERKAQLEEYAQRRGQDTAAALDVALEEYLAWEREDYNETVAAGVAQRRGPASHRTGYAQPV